jgi:hypothetical protein
MGPLANASLGSSRIAHEVGDGAFGISPVVMGCCVFRMEQDRVIAVGDGAV